MVRSSHDCGRSRPDGPLDAPVGNARDRHRPRRDTWLALRVQHRRAVSHGMKRTEKILMGLLLFNSVSSIGGGLALITGLITEQAAWVEHTDFPGLYFPGVILMAVVGGSSAIAAVAMAKRSDGWQMSSLAAGVIMLFWIVGEVASIRGFHFLQVVYFVTGALVVGCTPPSSSGRVRPRE
jgi:hypothetical protein